MGLINIGGLMPSYTNEKEIKEKIEIFKGEFHTFIKEKLDIEDMEYLIDIGTIRNIDGFPEDSIKASTIISKYESKVEKVVFFTKSISADINFRFAKITNSNMFKEVVSLYIMFVFIHELVHVKQIKNGMKIEEYNEIEYKINEFEQEANDKAKEILSEFGEFQREISYIIYSNKMVDNYSFIELIKLYKEKEFQ
ncbi:hypothetical protein [Bacillus cereus]|uniref:hypothetical protein n=1 Tax=Bacillus cereus TaxID=1396 RepID=UPI0024072827|nr:hypothetical protein [Bacillus cereus]MDF9545775.1 hypothetical protein [Bacillus cereus]